MIWVKEQAISGKIEIAYAYFKKLNQTLFRFGGLEKVLECRFRIIIPIK
jgi:hypothetical protein